MKNAFCAAIAVIAATVLATSAKAACSASLTNPLNLISGTTWAFQTSDVLDATVGIFTAQAESSNRRSPASTLTGVLTITETFNNYGDSTGVIENQVTGTGSYQIYPDCSGGILIFNIGENGYQYAFILADGGTKMYLASSNANVPNNSIFFYQNGNPITDIGNHGVARLLTGPPTCSAFPNPLSALVGNWSFLTHDYVSATVGTLNAQIQTSTRSPGTSTGVLNITETVSGVTGFPTTRQVATGQYQVYPDCSGGQLSFEEGTSLRTYAFVFAGPGEIYLVNNNSVGGYTTVGCSDVPSYSYTIPGRYGQAEKF
jgi:hypothetical protein